MISKQKNHSHVFVVDTRVADYGTLIEAFGQEGVGIEVFATGRAALRHDPSDPPDLWVINMHLSDFDGPDLLSMLRGRYPGVPVYLVSDEYTAEEEISARCSGAEMYFCKPLQESWLAAPVMLRH
jgi:two-component system response regulator (stage 0 sporulation protein F)